jgi:hypothetical protein
MNIKVPVFAIQQPREKQSPCEGIIQGRLVLNFTGMTGYYCLCEAWMLKPACAGAPCLTCVSRQAAGRQSPCGGSTQGRRHQLIWE